MNVNVITSAFSIFEFITDKTQHLILLFAINQLNLLRKQMFQIIQNHRQDKFLFITYHEQEKCSD